MVLLLLLFAAPILQVIFLALKAAGKIKIPSGLIAVFTFLLGILLSITAAKLSMPHIKCLDCGLVSFAFLFIGLVITAVATPVIELIYFVISRLITQTKQPVKSTGDYFS